MRKLNYTEWLKITSDLWILDTVKSGYKIEFNPVPDFSGFLPEMSFSKEKADIVSLEIEKLLQKGALEKVDSVEGQFISNIFLVPKKDGSLRPVINLKQLNFFVEYHHFKQENISLALDLIQKDDYLTSIDLCDAYFSISIHDDYKKYLRFLWKGIIYEFQVLCFGLASAPRIFTKLLKPVYSFFRKLGIRCIYYIDDSLNLNQNIDKCAQNTNIMVKKLDDLGYRINYKKSVLIPTKRIVFFGLIIDTELFKVFLTDEKVEKIISLGNSILSKREITIRCLASFVGLVVHAFYAVQFGPLHYRNLERNKISALRTASDDYESVLTISNESVVEIN